MRYAGLGVELAAAVALFTLAGWWVDGRFGTEPWGILIGAFIGLGGGMYNLVREGLEAARTSGGSDGAVDRAPQPPPLDKSDAGGRARDDRTSPPRAEGADGDGTEPRR